MTPGEILSACCEYTGVPTGAVLSDRRDATVVQARWLAMYLMRDDLHLSYPKIGTHLNRDHSTVMHGVNKMQRFIDHELGDVTLALYAIRQKLKEERDERKTIRTHL